MSEGAKSSWSRSLAGALAEPFTPPAGADGREFVVRKVQGLLLLGVVALLVWFAIAVYAKALPWQSTVRVTLQAQRIGHQLVVPADVKVRGLIVGQVTGVHVSGDHADLTLSLSPSDVRLIPSNVQARILPKTLFGEKFVDLVVPADPSPVPIHAGAVISEDRSANAVETETFFNDILPVLQDLHPAELNVTLTELATALQNRGAELGDNLARADAYFSAFNPHLPVVEQDISGLADLATSYADAAPNLVSLGRNFSVNARTLVQERDPFAQLLTGTRGFADTFSAILQRNEQTLISLAAVSRPTLDALAVYSPEFPCLFEGIDHIQPLLGQTFQTPSQSHPGLHIFLQILPKQPNGYTYPTDVPKDVQDVGPNCRGLPGAPNHSIVPSLAGTPPSGSAPAAAPAPGGAGIGLAGSPAEKAFLAALSAPVLGESDSQVPADLTDLLVGPMLRGMAVGLS